MNRTIILAFAASLAWGQNFPTSVSTLANLPGAANRARTTLATTVNNAITTIVLTSASGFAINVPFTIGTEDIICTSLTTNTFSSCTRGYDGSTAASHNSGVAVTGTIIAAHTNKLRLEVIAIETALGASLANVVQTGGLAGTATALAANPAACSANTFVTDTAANGDLTCAAPFALTTTGTSGASTFTGGTLNIPQYTGGGSTYTAGTGLTLTSTEFATDPAIVGCLACTDTISGTKTITGTVTANGATRTAPSKSGTSLPGTCTVADTYIKTDATNTNVLYVCTATNTWTAQGGSGSGGGLSGSSAIDFASIGDGLCLENTFALTGLVAGDTISVGLPSTISTGIIATGIVSATDTAKIRLCNMSGAAVDLASLTYSVTRPAAISASSAIDFSSIGDGVCLANTFTLTGAAAGTRVTPGYPAALAAGLQGTMAVTASDTIQVRLCNFSGAALDPASGTFSAAIL